VGRKRAGTVLAAKIMEVWFKPTTYEVLDRKKQSAHTTLRAKRLHTSPRPDIALQRGAHMDLADVQRLTGSPPAGPPIALTHPRLDISNRAPITASSAGPACAGHADRLVRLGPASESATAPSRRPVPIQPPLHHLKGLRHAFCRFRTRRGSWACSSSRGRPRVDRRRPAPGPGNLGAQQGPEAPLDPLVVALDDADDAVRTKAMTIIERQWAVAQEASRTTHARARRESVGATTTSHQGGAS